MNHFHTMPIFRLKLKNFFDHKVQHLCLGILIVLNLITLGLSTSHALMEEYGALINGFNDTVLVIFGVEVVFRMLAEGRSFFKDGWHVFDLIIIILAIVAFGGFAQVFRGLRIVWLLRLITVAPPLQHLVNSIIRAIPGIMSVATLLFLGIYMAALIGTVEFADTVPHLFASIPTSMATLTQTMLMEHTWSELYEKVAAHHPMAWVYVFPTMIILNYMLLHLVLGVIITALQKQYEEDEKRGKIEKV